MRMPGRITHKNELVVVIPLHVVNFHHSLEHTISCEYFAHQHVVQMLVYVLSFVFLLVSCTLNDSTTVYT